MYVEGWDEEDCFEYYYVEMIWFVVGSMIECRLVN
jgi:hypothetical protein